MIGKKAKSKQGNSRKPAAKEKKVVAAKSQPTKEAKEPQETDVVEPESFLIRWRFQLLLFFRLLCICPTRWARCLHSNHRA